MSAPLDNEQFRNLLEAWPEKAMVYLYDQYYNHLLRIADMYTRDRTLSEDAIQEVFADIVQKHKELARHHDNSIQAYLIKAVSYRAITLYKRTRSLSLRETEYFYGRAMTAEQDDFESKTIDSEKMSFLRVVLGTLPPREKECLLMQIDQDMAIKEIAARLGITVKAVERSLTSARKRLRKFRNNF